jgi:MFS family permease
MGESLKSNPDWYLARVDRLPTWGLSYAIIWALGFSFFITLYDVINVGFALPYIPFVVSASQASLIASLGLFGYVVGAPIFSYMADVIGRRPTLVFTALLTAIGSFGDAFSVNYPMLAIFRFLTGMAIGADLVLVMTYVTETAPASTVDPKSYYEK